ncbi:alternative oxidase-domain-containing protein [Zychaea mexicana]|uniref:alternative oxidase-domain-containing protein n=1 Tax=Zychaea mexicana TaxID=64656 RepID=UPI0022FDF2E5|nr:alternative oxidase-domain-containing protein [Zychaea mexicana]KAI9488491.1 alternative oxidase-domain-containing protein [Zychaea mexicana]
MLKLLSHQQPLFKQQLTSLAIRSTHTAAQKIPKDLLRELQATRPAPMRDEFLGSNKLTTDDLEKMDIDKAKHHVPETLSDKFAYRMVKTLRLLPDTYFGRDHYMRAVMLETIAAVPGMVGGMLRHMRSLRNLSEDNGWIIHLLHEAENERMHLMTWMKCLQPSLWNRLLILGAQGVFFNSYFWLYVFSPKTAHRMCGYLEEEAVVSYTHFLDDIDAGVLPNGPAPSIAIDYYNLHPSASIRDVVLAVRADEALHRDANHHLSDRIAYNREDIIADIKAEQLRKVRAGK